MFVLLLLLVFLVIALALGLAVRRPAAPSWLPPDLGVWKNDVESVSARSARACGLLRQERLCLRPARGRILGSDELVREVRYRSELTGAVVRVEPDQVVKLSRAVR